LKELILKKEELERKLSLLKMERKRAGRLKEF
jgi:hypothetical protein